jgi:predicted DNA-binding transcriptional regulator AlpA
MITRETPTYREPINDQLIDVERVAAIAGISTSTVRRLSASGGIPKPVRLNRQCRWRLSEINAWLAAGCPRVEHAGEPAVA